jgi:hypothetical protein
MRQTTWDDLGFLSDEAGRDAREVMENNPRWIGPAVQLSKHLNSSRARFAPKVGDLPGMISAALFARSLSTYEAIVMLACRGMRPESEALLRTLLELMFIQRAVTNRPDTVQDMLKADDYYRLRAFEEAGRARDLMPNRRPHTRQTVRLLKSRVRVHGVEGIPVEEFARRGKCLQIYRTLWRKLCEPSHGQLRDLDRHFAIDRDSGIMTADWGPDHGAGKITLLLAMWALIAVVEAGAATLGVVLGEEWEKIAGEFRSFPPC